jgi:hypothetical protein
MLARHWLLTFASLLFVAPAVQAGRLVDVQIVDRESDSLLRQYPHRSDNYIAGAPGHRYAVRIVNKSAQRVMAVLSVDGVNAISGQTAATDQTGYVLDPYQSTEVNGWRKNMNEIAAFEFTALRDSYAAQTGRPDNVGVIGVAVFREKYRRPPPVPRDQEIAGGSRADSDDKRARAPAPSAAPAGAAAESARSADGAAKRESLGTGHGDREYSGASYTSFERDSRSPYELVALRYDSWANLQARGIVPRRTPHRQREPNPFPDGFAPDPPRN